VRLSADKGSKRFRVDIPKLSERSAAHLPLPAEARDVVASLPVCMCDLGGRTVGDAADVNLIGR
jgi:hypothetical protein